MVSIVPEGQLVYGMQLPIQSQSRIYVEPWEEDAGRDELEAVVRKADECGFFYVAVCDHVAVPKPFDESMQTTWYDTIATLGWIAALTEHVRVLSHVFVAAYRHPLMTAKAFCTLDELSGGRAICGIGVGHVEKEFEVLGIDFAERGDITDEAVDLIRSAFGQEFPTGEGPRFPVADAGIRPRPRQEQLPIWIGGSSRPALRRAAERGDGWLPQGTPRHEMPESIAFLREHREQALGDEPIDIGTICEPYYVGEPSWDVGKWTITGPPERIAEKVRELGEMGVSHVQIRPRSQSLSELLDQMEAFGTEVAPLLVA
jgi:probable F420-dependent oxidoreductase